MPLYRPPNNPHTLSRRTAETHVCAASCLHATDLNLLSPTGIVLLWQHWPPLVSRLLGSHLQRPATALQCFCSASHISFDWLSPQQPGIFSSVERWRAYSSRRHVRGIAAEMLGIVVATDPRPAAGGGSVTESVAKHSGIRDLTYCEVSTSTMSDSWHVGRKFA